MLSGKETSIIGILVNIRIDYLLFSLFARMNSVDVKRSIIIIKVR